VGGLALFHGFGSIANYTSSFFKLPSFYIFWIVLGLALGLGVLVLENDISTELLFPPLFILGASLSTFAVLAWAYRRMGFPVTWRQASLAFVSGSTLSIIVTLILGSLLTYVIYMLVSPFWYLAEEIAYLGLGAPGFIERIFASPFIIVFLVVTALEAPIPEEFAKALGIPMFGRGRIQNERQAFAIGLASGAGFAVLENMLYEGMYAQYYGWGWAGITLLRSIGAVLHPIGTGIIALGWFRMKEGGGAGKLFKAYLLSVGLHTLWNGGFEPLLYLTGLEYFAGAGPSLSLYGETLSALLVGYLVLLSLGLWWLLRKIVNEISERVTPDLEPASVSRHAIAAWAVACALVIVPVGATFSPAWNAISAIVVDGEIRTVQYPEVGSREEAEKAFENEIVYLNNLSDTRPDFSGITQPGDRFTYRINLDKSRPALWSYTWCTTTQEILAENFNHIFLEFVVGNAVIRAEKIAVHDFDRSSGDGVCRESFVVVTDFPRGRHHMEIRVTFDKDIDDGWDVYPAGTHYYESIVSVRR
ncbi:MAG TPA: PrsW family glutamic-type intramembrane protease, partial [Anaerolineales bacterium]|nr:PrsW family glutamic-type intramembrane protease [Anaerolineales bacterium]